MKPYRLENDTFIIDDFDRRVPFCSFLPGLTGEKGVPVWSFYVNRGQCMTSFGIDHKDNPIMEFQPANIAYENTAVKGFRTFVRKNGEFFEPFFINRTDDVRRSMRIKQNSFAIVEENRTKQFKTEVEYFILPNEPFGALVRRVKFTNTGNSADFELLDGIPRIIPYGVSGSDFARMANLMRSYNTMSNLENKIPMFYNQICGDDDAEVKLNEGGYFYMTFDKNGLITPIFDPCAIFGEETSLIFPDSFADGGIDGVMSYNQHSTNKICGCFTPAKLTLDCGESYEISSLCGYACNAEFINAQAEKILKRGYIDEKLAQADELAHKFTNDIDVKSGNPVLDMYFIQCFLDNFLRGGYPFIFKSKDKNKVVHLFSRKHGDPERDYNFFSIAAEYYSQGDGNFRDVLQNRRNDVLFNPDVYDFDIEMFFSYMQFDGYNPLNVKGTTFTVKDGRQNDAQAVTDRCISKNANAVKTIISKKFTAGSLINGIYASNAELTVSDDELLNELLPLCDQNYEATTDKHGNWSDHWDYLMDLVDCFLKVYPDRLKELLFDNKNYKYFDSDMFIRPRSQKYFFNGKEPRQFESFIVDNEKYRRGYIDGATNWLKTANGEIYHTNLIEKMISLCVNKFALLDPNQTGIEMEANRAGWCDAANGLPSMFGSGMSETFELKRLCKFVIKSLKSCGVSDIALPTELKEFFDRINDVVATAEQGYEFWDRAALAREDFREKTRYTISGDITFVKSDDVISALESYVKILDEGIERAKALGKGFCPTYFKFKPTKYEITRENEGGYPNVHISEFEPVAVAKFLEAPAKQIRECRDKSEAEKILAQVIDSNLYDKKLKMFKVCESLENEGPEFGRIAAFTGGWQENESVFLHMEYKFLYGILKSGIYPEFFRELKNTFIPFTDPEIYGRSILENCSFIASSANPDENLHGRGFVSRLSGSTTEVISIWSELFIGDKPFVFDDGRLGLNIRPIVDKTMFDNEGKISFNFLGTNRVTIFNPDKIDIYGAAPKYVIIDGVRYNTGTVYGNAAKRVRDERKSAIELHY